MSLFHSIKGISLLTSTSIMKEGYLKTKPECRPRVFGMTASPLDAKCDPVKAAQ